MPKQSWSVPKQHWRSECDHRFWLAYYRVGGNSILDVEVEAKVDHVENSMASQCRCQSFIQAPQSEPVWLNYAPCLSEWRGLLYWREWIQKEDVSHADRKPNGACRETHYSILFLSTSVKESLLAWRLTFTTSNGLTTTASVKPAPSPATDSAWGETDMI